LANSYPQLADWAMGWVDEIGGLYHLNAMRLQAPGGSAERAKYQAALRQAVASMARRREDAMADTGLAEPAAKVLRSMKEHWAGLTVFVKRAWVPMDNNTAERDARLAVVGRKSFYGSASLWSGQLAATMYSLLMTAKLWNLNARAWLGEYLQACADNGGRAPLQLERFLPWAMDAARLAALRAPSTAQRIAAQAFDTS
jgi:transposase